MQFKVKRGQISANVFIYVTVIVIFGVTLALGYNYISGAKGSIEKAELALLKSQITDDIGEISKDYGTFRKKSYSIPKTAELCLVDLNRKDEILGSELINFYPFVKDSIESDIKDNLFVLSETYFDSFFVGDIEINHYPHFECLNPDKGKVKFGIEGLGNKSLIITAFIVTADLEPGKETELQSPDGIIKIIIPENITATENTISIEMLEPTPLSVVQKASDIYRIGPPGITFSYPVELRIRYNSNSVEGCPSKLTYYQSSEDGTEQSATDSRFVDCEGRTAVFSISRFI